jgi:hypothetical protein
MQFMVMFCQLLIAMIFTASAVGKVRKRQHFRDFTTTVERLVPGRLATSIAYLVVAAEFAVIALTLAPPTRMAGLLLAAILLIGFAAVAEFAVRTGRVVTCNCFGGASDTVLGRTHVVRNIVLAGVATTGLVATALTAPRVDADIVLTASLAAFAVAAPLARWEDIRSLFAKSSI